MKIYFSSRVPTLKKKDTISRDNQCIRQRITFSEAVRRELIINAFHLVRRGRGGERRNENFHLKC